MKDSPQLSAGCTRSSQNAAGRDEQGRFIKGNKIARDQAAISTVAKSLGLPSHDPDVTEVAKQARQLYRSTLRELPSTGASVRQLVAAQCRHGALATYYANMAAKEGLGTERGMAMAEASRRHDQAAQRLSVTAYDRAVREANAKPAEPVDLAVALGGTSCD